MSFGSVSRFRGELMGLAIVFIVLFHVGLGRASAFYGLYRMGNVGVDIFFFLSGVGLWFAWDNSPSVKRFYLRRLARIYPAWLIVATMFYLPDFLGSQRYSSSAGDLIGDILINKDFWLHDELTFWYIPATMALYIAAPWYMKLLRRNRDYCWLAALAMVWCVAVQWVPPVHNAVGHLEIFWSRVPIFLIGINAGGLVMRKERLQGSSVWLILIIFAAALATCVCLEQTLHGRFPLFIERMLYIPLTVTFCLLMPLLLAKLPRLPLSALCWTGSLSLEIYLLHCSFVMRHISPLHLGYWPTALLTLAITLPIAWLLHRLTTAMRRQ